MRKEGKTDGEKERDRWIDIERTEKESKLETIVYRRKRGDN